MGDEKDRLRREIQRRLSAMPSEQIREQSRRVEELLFAESAWQQAGTVYCYVSLPREVQTAGIRRTALDEGKRLALPRVEADGIRFHAVSDPDQPLSSSAFSVEEPPADLPILEPAPQPRSEAPAGPQTQTNQLVIVPGLAFDLDRYRLGRGRGYYDRFLALHGGWVRTIALCFDLQIVERVPRAAWDVRMDRVISDRRTL